MPRSPWRLLRPPAPPVPSPPDGERGPILDLGLATDIGGRAENQDRARIGERWAVVSDGVGGHAGGARAATLAVAAASDVLDSEEGAAPRPVHEAVRAAHAAVRAGQVDDPTVHDMAATVTIARVVALSVGGSRWAVGHVGDSPAWRVTPDGGTQLTIDHTLTGELLAAGAIDAEAAAHHPGRSYVTRVAGAAPGADPDVVGVDVAPGHALVIATDGVSDVLDPDAVAAAVWGPTDATAAADALVSAAGAAGSTDNITAVVIRHLSPSVDEVSPNPSPGRALRRRRPARR